MIRKGLMLSFIPLVVMLAFGAWGFSSASDGQVFPVHWGIDGRPDRFGGPLEAFFGLPFIGVLVTAILAAVPMLDPRGENIRRAEPFYLTVWMALVWFLAVLQAAMTMTALEHMVLGEDLMIRVVGSGVGILVLVIGNVLGKSRPNWFAGVRTPWTLSSDLSWEKTHRLAGKLFVLVGAACTVGAWIAPPTVFLPAMVVSIAAVSLIAVVYSWMVWRTAPDRRRG